MDIKPISDIVKSILIRVLGNLNPQCQLEAGPTDTLPIPIANTFKLIKSLDFAVLGDNSGRSVGPGNFEHPGR